MSRSSRRRQSWISGIFCIDKPAGMTSHDVVAAVRRASQERRVGHSGTLDPMATGVLLICMGKATRVSEYLMAGRKRYRALIRLGSTTDTYDATGRITSQTDGPLPAREELERALASFVGEQDQVPPMYSAIKQDGTPLYRLARKGIEAQRAPRRVSVFQFRMIDWSPPDLAADITCSKGTYVRSLAHDLGEALGCGAHLAQLVRTASGSFTLEHAVPLQAILDSFADSTWSRHLLPIDAALQAFPAWTLDVGDVERVRQGQQIAAEAGGPPVHAQQGNGEETLCRAYAPNGDLVAILRYIEEVDRWQPAKVFSSD